MQHRAVAMIQFSEALRGRWPDRPFFGLARFESDDEEHPYGRWSIRVEPWSAVDSEGRVRAWIGFVSSEAPLHLIRRDARFRIFIGPKEVAEVTVNVSAAEDVAKPSARNEALGLMSLLDRPDVLPGVD